jgi:steroid 5-alpha reductase family enzyme
MSSIVLGNLLLILGLLFLLWVLSVWLRDASIVDPFWGTGFVVVTGSTWLSKETHLWRDHLLLAMVTLWGLRLSIYLLWRNIGKGEDRRYQAMREGIGPRFWWISLFSVFALQGFLLWLISMPAQWGQLALPIATGWTLFDVAGVAIYSVGLFFEAVGDAQLARFKRDPTNRGRVMNRGLWRFTRHPNYFGDFAVWWGIYGVAVAGGAWWTFFGPAIISFFLMKVSGVTLLERDMADRRPEYRDYQRSTSPFFPWFPKRTSIVKRES